VGLELEKRRKKRHVEDWHLGKAAVLHPQPQEQEEIHRLLPQSRLHAFGVTVIFSSGFITDLGLQPLVSEGAEEGFEEDGL